MTDAVTKILIVEHDSNDIELIQRELKKGNIKHVTEIVETENAYINALRNFAPDIILCDYSLPAFNGLAAFEIREKISPDTPFIFVSGTIGEENSIELIRNGVTDFALKDKLFSLSVKVNRALKEAKEAQKKQAVEKALIQSEINLRAIFESTDTGLLLIDTNFKIISFNKQVNHFAEKSFGFPFRENVSFIEMFMPERQGEFNDMLDKVLKGETINYETTYPLTNGKIIWYKIKGNPVLNQGRNVIGICVTIDNITARKKSEQKLIKVNRLYYFISQINQMIVHITDEQTLFKEACNIAIDIGKFRMAWIGMIDEETKKVIPVMHAGEESGYLSKIKVIPLDTEPKEKGPVGTAMRENRHIICNNIETDPLMAPWKAEALNRGYRSLIALPIKKFGKIAGAFSLYSSELNFFDDAEIALLDEVTGDISFALENYEKEEQRKRTEEIIHEREQSLSSIYNTTADIIFVLEIEKSERYLFSSVNNAFVRTTGIPHNAVIGKYVNDIVPQPSLNLVLEKYKEAIEQKKIVRWEETSDYPNGRLTGEVSVSPTFDKTGNCIRLVGAVHDITERKKTEEERLRLSSILEATSDFVGIAAPDQRITFLNQAGRKALGYGEMEDLSQTKVSDYSPDWATEIILKEGIPAALNNGKWIGETAFLTMAGVEIPISQVILSHKNSKGELQYLSTISRDITVQKESEHKLEQQNRELQKTNSELDRFVYSTSHDLRAPLKSMLGLIRITKESTEPGNSMQHERLEMLNKSVIKLDDFIEDILHYSRNTRLEVAKDEINFEEVIQEIRSSHKFMEGTRGLKLQVEAHQKEKFISDKRRVNVILNNLISNAIKYGDESKEKSFVKIFIRCSKENAVITIEDNGIGIADKDKEKIFEMFYRATKLSTGSGLGMYIVKETLEKLGGKINMESELNKGTKFTVEIPNQLLL